MTDPKFKLVEDADRVVDSMLVAGVHLQAMVNAIAEVGSMVEHLDREQQHYRAHRQYALADIRFHKIAALNEALDVFSKHVAKARAKEAPK